MHESSRPSALQKFPIVVEMPILWGDLDAYGHVNNLIYLKWFEAARAIYASRVGVSVTPQQEGLGAGGFDVMQVPAPIELSREDLRRCASDKNVDRQCCSRVSGYGR